MRLAQHSKIELIYVSEYTVIDRSEMANQLSRHLTSTYCHWIFQWHIPSGRTMALGSTQPLVKMNTKNISWR